MKYSYILVFIVPLIVLILLESLLIYPQSFFWIAAIIFLLIFVTQFVFTRASKTHNDWWNFLILPLVFSSGLLVYVSILDKGGFNNYLTQLLFLICASFLYSYFKNTYYILIKPALASGHFLENISSFGNFLALFFFSASIYAMRSFLGVSIWPLIVIIAVAMLLIIYQVTWANKINIKQGLVYIILGALLVSEIAVAISFLPLNFNALGLILAICYYTLIGFIRFFARGNLNQRNMKFYLLLGISSLLILLFSARWT